MVYNEVLSAILAFTLALLAGAIDIRTRTIPNILTFPAAVSGCALWLLTCRGPADIAVCAASSALTFALCWAIWRSGGWGGGDAKLVTSLGCLLPVVTVNGNAVPFAAVFFGWLAACLACRHSLFRLRKFIPALQRRTVGAATQGRPLAPVILAALSLQLLIPAPWARNVF